MAVVGLLAFDLARSGWIEGYITLASCVGVLAGLMAIVGIVAWWMWKLFRAMIAWRGELAPEVGSELLTPGWLTGALLLGWAVVLAMGEMRRNRAVERWLRRRALLERMPITRGQVIARVLVPQLKIVASHGMLILVIGWAYRALELDGRAEMWLQGTTILVAGLAYLLVAQVFIFHRGLDRSLRIAAMVLAAIALLLSMIPHAWPFILAVSVSIFAVAVAWVAMSWVLPPATQCGPFGPRISV